MTTIKRKRDDLNKTILEDFQEFTASMSNRLNEREQKIAKREQDLEQAIGAFEKEKEKYGAGGSYSPSDVISFNIGGNTSLTTLRSTLTSVPDSMLASRFSGRWDDSLEKDKDGNFFIDQPFEFFEAMINYLRMKASETPYSEPTQSPTAVWFGETRYAKMKFKGFKAMVEYYGMTSAVFPTELIIHEIGLKIPGLEVNDDIVGIIELHPRGHNRKIIAFEITINEVANLQIGWIRKNQDCKCSSKRSLPLIDHTYSVVLDCAQSRFFYYAGHEGFDEIQIQNNSVIRSERKGNKWFVDGQKISSPDLDIAGYSTPAFTGTGAKWKVSKVEFESDE